MQLEQFKILYHIEQFEKNWMGFARIRTTNALYLESILANKWFGIGDTLKHRVIPAAR